MPLAVKVRHLGVSYPAVWRLKHKLMQAMAEREADRKLIHMNGRIYDQELGRFLQADPVIQAPDNAQSWNAYTYVFNNPLAYTDPTGLFSIGKLFKAVAAAVVMYFTAGAASLWIYAGASAASIGTGLAIMAAGGFIAGAITTGTLKGGLYGAFGAALTGGILAMQLGPVSGVIAQGVSGGIMESIQGGSFGSGFVAAGLTASFMPQVGRIQNDIGRTLTGALVGGTISEATGGKFANGAMSGAIQGAMARNGQQEAPGQPERGSRVEITVEAQKDFAARSRKLQGVTYETEAQADRAFADAFLPFTNLYGIEVGANITYMGKYRLEDITLGNATSVATPFNRITVADIHTHPAWGADGFSGTLRYVKGELRFSLSGDYGRSWSHANYSSQYRGSYVHRAGDNASWHFDLIRFRERVTLKAKQQALTTTRNGIRKGLIEYEY